MPGITAKLTIKDGSQEEFISAMQEMQAAVKANEPGCMYYDLFRTEDATVFAILERYVDADALAAHGKTDHMRSFGKKIRDIMAGAPAVEIYQDI